MPEHGNQSRRLAPNVGFRLMAWMFKVRDVFSPRDRVLEEAGIRQGWHVLDFGCGPGGYVPATSRAVGESGKVYALDVHPLAIDAVDRAVSKLGLTNVETILSDCATGLADRSIDAVLLYDTYHALDTPRRVIAEIERVLKPNGILSFSDHHMLDEEIVSELTRYEAFVVQSSGRKTYTFVKHGTRH